ncbi:hypothetical protein C7B77_27550 [Chamaesiphon polymorphus CCALA 037]|uniref:Uncharacterized protein n=1 Tax=Chamaesiphon polymorphus CCALA 037 TaxID=2107692 RepID=A0A2T1F8K4_9CYAN|nr:hypothetical protein C7B77_27550 [Chamaesiphon polymorphus CCALA 037]
MLLVLVESLYYLLVKYLLLAIARTLRYSILLISQQVIVLKYHLGNMLNPHSASPSEACAPSSAVEK